MGYAINRQFAAFTLILLPLSLWADNVRPDAAAQDLEAETLPVVRLSPRIREQDRDRSYYQSLDCRKLGQADTHSDLEKRWLDERKSACLEQYRAFSPQYHQR